MATTGVTSVNNSTSSAISTKSSANAESLQSNFMTLLIAQLRNQDPLSPATNEEFIAQLAQLQSLDETKKISSSLSSMASSQEFSSASALIGRTVSGTTTAVTGSSQEFSGAVFAVSQEDGKVKVKIAQEDGSTVIVNSSEIREIQQ